MRVCLYSSSVMGGCVRVMMRQDSGEAVEQGTAGRRLV